MTDDRLRALERRFGETGSVEDEAAWLMERVRVGELTEERLHLAGHCGHPAAGLVAAEVVPCSELHKNADLREWSVSLVEFGGRVAAVRALLALGWRFCLEIPETGLSTNAEELMRLATNNSRAVELWLLDPNTRTRKKAARGGSTYFHHSVSGWSAQSLEDRLVRAFYSETSWASRAVSTGNPWEIGPNLGQGIGASLQIEERLNLRPGGTWTAVVSAVLPWALGLHDPVAERVAAREVEQ